MAAIPAVEQVLKEWDIKQTDVLLEKLETDRNTRQEQEKKLREAENNRFVQALYLVTFCEYSEDFVVLPVLLEIPLLNGSHFITNDDYCISHLILWISLDWKRN